MAMGGNQQNADDLVRKFETSYEKTCMQQH